jgi:hypothetical protein
MDTGALRIDEHYNDLHKMSDNVFENHPICVESCKVYGFSHKILVSKKDEIVDIKRLFYYLNK